MKLKAIIVSLEDGSYTKQDRTTVQQDRLTVLDQDGPVLLKDTIDVVIPRSDRTMLGDAPIGRLVTFDISELRPPMGGGTRMRASGRIDTSKTDLSKSK